MNNTKKLTNTIYHLTNAKHDFEIKTEQDVVDFIGYIVNMFDFQSYYPFDDNFADLVEYNLDTNITTYLFSKPLAKIYNKLTADCYDLVGGEKIHKIYNTIVESTLGNKNITGGAL